MWPKGIWGTCHRSWKRKTSGGSWPHGMAAFSFVLMMSGLCLSFPSEPMALRVLGALLNITDPDQLLPSPRETSFSSGHGTQSWPELCCGHVYLWPCLLDGPISCLQSHLLPLAAGWTLETPGGFVWSEAAGESHCCDLQALPPLQTLWDCHSASEGMACAGSPVLPGLIHSWHSPAHTAPAETRFMPCEKSPMKNSVKPFRALEMNRGVIINFCRITSLCNAKMCNPRKWR